MKALIIYPTLVILGSAISVFIGYFVEARSTPATSLVIFLALFFANLVASWIGTILIIDGSLADAQGALAQLAAESKGRPNQLA
jgi:hypothetical protein